MPRNTKHPRRNWTICEPDRSRPRRRAPSWSFGGPEFRNCLQCCTPSREHGHRVCRVPYRPNLCRQPEECNISGLSQPDLSRVAAGCHRFPRSPSQLLCSFPPPPFSLQNPLHSSPTSVRTKALQWGASARLKFLIAARPITAVANCFSCDDPRVCYQGPGGRL